MLQIGVDTGGTFTDFIWRDGDKWGEYKLLSTPDDPAEAVLAGLRYIGGDRNIHLVHGSTVATNAILEKKGARTALVTNAGFEDIIEIGRQNRSNLYDLTCRRNPPLVPRDRRFGLSCRVDANGQIVESLADSELQGLVAKLRDAGVESVAVSLLFSFLEPQHELQIGGVLKPLNLPISLSHQTLAEFREYERTSTTLINAYVAPKMQTYLSRLQNEIGKEGFRIMQSNGGSISATTAMRESVRTILSGPAGGVVGAWRLGSLSGFPRLITFDMGGTSTDVALIDDRLPLTTESSIADFPVKVPMLDIHTVGAGGGSMAMVDSGGGLKVGPESAGADPGPICYGRGEHVTVTDANLFLGRLIPEQFLGGGMSLQAERVAAPINRLANSLGLGGEELAEGVLAIANTTMERAIKVISVERGYDPREFVLFSFGGAGGMHAAYLARGLDIPKVLIPQNPGILSAAGMLMADVIKDYSRTVMLPETEVSINKLDRLFAPLEEKGKTELHAEGVPEGEIRLERYLDMRYRGQSFEIMVPESNDWREAFHCQHELLYGYANREREIELVNLRLRSIGHPAKPELPELEPGGSRPPDSALLGERETIFDGVRQRTKIIDRARLARGNTVQGPAILVEYSSTIVVPRFASVEVDRFGNLLMTIDA
ncbi:MAG: 5-oxoprolinase [Desulfuromonas sp.]|nr:MAG: 5-oxoprolinase [Desulfuromonas sp.]